MITQNQPINKQGFLFVSSYTHHRPLANASCLVAGAIVISLAFHPPAIGVLALAAGIPVCPVNGAQDHDYLTFVVTGKTAEQSRLGCELIAGSPKIGLNYQPSPEELDLIGAIKMKFCTYGKGDWKSRIERAYADLNKQ